MKKLFLIAAGVLLFSRLMSQSFLYPGGLPPSMIMMQGHFLNHDAAVFTPVMHDHTQNSMHALDQVPAFTQPNNFWDKYNNTFLYYNRLVSSLFIIPDWSVLSTKYNSLNTRMLGGFAFTVSKKYPLGNFSTYTPAIVQGIPLVAGTNYYLYNSVKLQLVGGVEKVFNNNGSISTGVTLNSLRFVYDIAYGLSPFSNGLANRGRPGFYTTYHFGSGRSRKK